MEGTYYAMKRKSYHHGDVSLLLEDQISHTVLERFSIREMLVATLNQIARVDLAAGL
jgi:hypothetical protein